MERLTMRGGTSANRLRPAAGLLPIVTLILTAGCASTESLVDSPQVSLTDVELTHAGFDGQTFMLSFDVANPNPFPLPVTLVRYQIKLANQKFASGEAQSDIWIPAGGSGEFDLQVELDLLRQASGLVSVVRSGMRNHIEYELYGSMSVDIPLAPAIAFSNTGSIQIDGKGF